MSMWMELGNLMGFFQTNPISLYCQYILLLYCKNPTKNPHFFSWDAMLWWLVVVKVIYRNIKYTSQP